MKTLRVLDDIRRLFSSKADNLSYNNGQLQLTADNKPIGLPLSIVTGGSINSFVSGVNNGIFIAPTNDISTFTIMDYQSSKIVTLIKENYVLVQNKDFSIDNTGLVTLSYPLEKDQFVAWVMMHTTYDYNDLANKPTIGSGGVSLKISETEPSTELVSGLVWYRPSTRSLAMYIETTGFIKLNSSEGEVQMFEQVFTAVAPTGVIDITIPDLNVRDVLLVDHDGATLYEGINHSINYTESKLNLLAHELKIGESIHIVCIRVSNGSTAVLDKVESIYTAQEAGITIVPINIIGFDTSQIYIVDHDGAILHEGVNYEVLHDMKNIQLLNFAMEAGERIHILNIKMISSEATKAMLDDMRDKVTDVVTKVDAKIDIVDIVNDTTSGGTDKVLSAEQGKVLNSAIGQLQTDIGNIDVSWDAITGKPTTFAPSTHTHLGLNGTNAVLEVQEYIDFHKNFSSSDYDARMHMEPTTGALEWFSALNSSHSMNITGEINSLKSSVVNGKQSVVNAIDGSLGYASGLTTSHTHDDYAWWIQNKVAARVFNTITQKTATFRLVNFASGYNNATWETNTYGGEINIDCTQVSTTSSELYHFKYNLPITVHSGTLYLTVPTNTIARSGVCVTSGGTSCLAFPVGTYQTVEFIVPVMLPSSTFFSVRMRILNVSNAVVGHVNQPVTFSISAPPSNLTVTALAL